MQKLTSKDRVRLLGQRSGFSLMELMIVLVIIGIFITFGARKLVNRGTEMKSAVRKFSAMSRKLRNRARLDNKTYRLVFDFPIEKDKQQSYWVEGTSKQALLLNEEQKEELEENLDEVEDKEGNKFRPDPQGFTMDNAIVKNAPATLPNGLFFESIELDGDPIEKITEGRVYIYYFPQGYVQSSAIHLTDREELNWTLVVNSLTGVVDMYSRYRSLEDFKTE